MPIPDLLCSTPSVRLDVALLKQTLTFAFASGVPEAAFAQALEAATLPTSRWDPRTFARELFVSDFVASLKVVIDGHPFAIDERNLEKILSRPPSDPEVVEFRRAIL